MITFEGEPEGSSWRLLRDRRLICFCAERTDTERMLIGFFEAMSCAAKSAQLIMPDERKGGPDAASPNFRPRRHEFAAAIPRAVV